MAQAIVTPTDLREFANILQKNIDEFTHIENSMNQKLNSYDWRDPVAMKFKANFEATKEPLNKLRQQMEEFKPYLTKKADTLDGGYLGSDSGNANFETFAVAGGAAAVVVTGAIFGGKNYSSVFRGVDLSYINWGHKTPRQKIAELQKLENNIARIQGREPDRISGERNDTWKTWDDYKRGEKITLGTHSGNDIKINQSLLEGDNTYEKLKVLVNTVAHEGQHDNQEEKNLFPNNTGANYINIGDNKPVCIIEYSNGQIDKKATVLKFQQAAISNPQAQVHSSWRTANPNRITNSRNIDGNYQIVQDTISSSNPPLSAECDWNDYAHGNEKEIDSRKFGSYIEKRFEQKFPERPQRTMPNSINNESRPITMKDLEGLSVAR